MGAGAGGQAFGVPDPSNGGAPGPEGRSTWPIPSVAPARTRSRMQETVLPNGVRVLTEHIPDVRSVALGVWVRQGSAHESPAQWGASHLLEHMVFKGTERRSPREIALALESLGGSLDGYTSREHTSYQARVLDAHVGEALDVLSDLVLHPLLRPEDLELEREVVLEEIATVHDTPDDLVFELHGEGLWEEHPYAHSILGTRDSVESMDTDLLSSLHQERYRKGGLVVAAAGNLEHGNFAGAVEESLGELPPANRAEVTLPQDEQPVGMEHVHRDSAQTHIVFGSRIPPRTDPRRFGLILLSVALGGGMSSRLFQKVREEMALAYTVFSFQSFYARGGVSGVYVGTRPEWADRTVDAVQEELGRLAQEGLSPDEVEQIKTQVKGEVMLSLESTSSRLYRLAGFALYDQPFLTLDELLARIDAVTPEEMAELAARYFDPDRQFVLRLGPGTPG